jgi:hypothetical protein
MKYTAFISYNSKDDRWAKWLQRKLEVYSMPVVIRNEKDEVVTLYRNGEVDINIHRDDTYGVLAGTIIDEKGQPVGGATIEAEGETCTSQEDGSFKLSIPMEKQKRYPHIRISKEGYQTEEYTRQGVGLNWQVILMK